MNFQDIALQWELFWQSYLVIVFNAVPLSLCGVYLIGKRQEFMAASVSKATLFGIALYICLQAHHSHSDSFFLLLGSAFAMTFLTLSAFLIPQNSRNSLALQVTAFLFFGSGVTLLLTHHPQSLEELTRLINSNIVGTGNRELFLAVLSLVFTSAILHSMRHKLLLWCIDSKAFLRLHGFTPVIIYCALCSLSLSLSITSMGILLSFALLVLPAICSRLIAGSFERMWAISAILALTPATITILISTTLDFHISALLAFILSSITLALLIRTELR